MHEGICGSNADDIKYASVNGYTANAVKRHLYIIVLNFENFKIVLTNYITICTPSITASVNNWDATLPAEATAFSTKKNKLA